MNESAANQSIRDQYNAALDFALDKISDAFERTDFLLVWREGDWIEIRKSWPEFKGPFPSDAL